DGDLVAAAQGEQGGTGGTQQQYADRQRRGCAVRTGKQCGDAQGDQGGRGDPAARVNRCEDEWGQQPGDDPGRRDQAHHGQRQDQGLVPGLYVGGQQRPSAAGPRAVVDVRVQGMTAPGG